MMTVLWLATGVALVAALCLFSGYVGYLVGVSVGVAEGVAFAEKRLRRIREG